MCELNNYHRIANAKEYWEEIIHGVRLYYSTHILGDIEEYLFRLINDDDIEIESVFFTVYGEKGRKYDRKYEVTICDKAGKSASISLSNDRRQQCLVFFPDVWRFDLIDLHDERYEIIPGDGGIFSSMCRFVDHRFPRNERNTEEKDVHISERL